MEDIEAMNLFKEIAKDNMVYYNEDSFKNTHNNLYRTILLSIKEAYKQGKNTEIQNDLNPYSPTANWVKPKS